jgi:hypothetical protein
MSLRFSLRGAAAASALAVMVGSGSAAASPITQNTSWTIQRSGATSTYRVVAYGDSLFAGYNGGLWSMARRAASRARWYPGAALLLLGGGRALVLEALSPGSARP